MLFITKKNHAKVIDAKHVKGAFHTHKDCHQLLKHCNCDQDAVEISVSAIKASDRSYLSHVLIADKPVGCICNDCFNRDRITIRKAEIAGALRC